MSTRLLAGRRGAPRRPAQTGRVTLGGALSRVLPVTPVAWLCLVFVTPLVFTVLYAFAHATFGGVQLGFTFENFKQALSGFYLTIFLRTIRFALIGTACCLVVSAPLAYFLARKAGRLRPLLVVLMLVPFWTSFLIRTLAWRTLLAPDGPISHVLNFLGIHHGALNVLDTQTAVMIGIVYGYMPLMALPLFMGFERVPASDIEASKDLGAGRVQTFLRVTLPLARPGLTAGILLTMVPMTGEYVIPALLGGEKGVLIGGLIADQYLQAQNYALGSAMAVLVLALLGIAVFAITRVSRGFATVEQ